MPDASQITERQRDAYTRAATYLNEATNHLQNTGLSFADTLISVLYEAAMLMADLHREASPSEAELAAVAEAIAFLSHECADALTQPPKSRRVGWQ